MYLLASSVTAIRYRHPWIHGTCIGPQKSGAECVLVSVLGLKPVLEIIFSFGLSCRIPRISYLRCVWAGLSPVWLLDRPWPSFRSSCGSRDLSLDVIGRLMPIISLSPGFIWDNIQAVHPNSGCH